jgi:hypothetical protein
MAQIGSSNISFNTLRSTHGSGSGAISLSDLRTNFGGCLTTEGVTIPSGSSAISFSNFIGTTRRYNNVYDYQTTQQNTNGYFDYTSIDFGPAASSRKVLITAWRNFGSGVTYITNGSIASLTPIFAKTGAINAYTGAIVMHADVSTGTSGTVRIYHSSTANLYNTAKIVSYSLYASANDLQLYGPSIGTDTGPWGYSHTSRPSKNFTFYILYSHDCATGSTRVPTNFDIIQYANTGSPSYAETIFGHGRTTSTAPSVSYSSSDLTRSYVKFVTACGC